MVIEKDAGNSSHQMKRSKTGCWSCRKRKIKCDETHPVCKRCAVFGYSCEWPTAVSRDASDVRSSIPAALPPKDGQLQCSNSITLTPHDRLYLQFFPSSLMYNLFTFGSHCVMTYMFSDLARSSRLVMHMMLATSAAEMHKGKLRVGMGSGHVYLRQALRHYDLALRRLRTCLAKCLESDGDNEDEPVDALLTTIFFLVHYEAQFYEAASGPERMRTHMDGLWALISTHPLFKQKLLPSDAYDDVTAARLSLSCQIIQWLLYTDISGANFGTCISLYNLISNSDIPLFDFDNLQTAARLSSKRLYGGRYGLRQQLIDMEMRRPTEFGWDILVMKFKMWDRRVRGVTTEEEKQDAASLLQDILLLKEKYFEIILYADNIPQLQWKPTTEIYLRICCFYYAGIIMHRRMLGDQYGYEALYNEAMNKLMGALFLVCEKLHEKRRAVRLVCPLLMAAIETQDLIHRKWLLDRLGDIRTLNKECQWSFVVANKIIELQSEPGSPRADLADFMRWEV